MQGKKIKAHKAGGKENRRCFTWQASSLCSANFSSLASVSPLLMKASASSSMALSRPQSSSQRVHSCKSRHRRRFFLLLRIARVRISANGKFENGDFSILTSLPPLFSENFTFLSLFYAWIQNAQPNKPGSSSGRPLPAPAPGAAEPWLWPPAAATHLRDTPAIRAGAGTGFAQRPAETPGPAGASG